MNSRSCATCEHSKGTEQGLLCVRFPPTLVVFRGDVIRTRWPIVASDDYCGEWKPGETTHTRG